jgi:hypothetical protein
MRKLSFSKVNLKLKVILVYPRACDLGSGHMLVWVREEMNRRVTRGRSVVGKE